MPSPPSESSIRHDAGARRQMQSQSRDLLQLLHFLELEKKLPLCAQDAQKLGSARPQEPGQEQEPPQKGPDPLRSTTQRPDGQADQDHQHDENAHENSTTLTHQYTDFIFEISNSHEALQPIWSSLLGLFRHRQLQCLPPTAPCHCKKAPATPQAHPSPPRTPAARFDAHSTRSVRPGCVPNAC